MIDGDTIVADVYLPLSVTLRDQRIRFAGWNAPELDTAEGQDAKEMLQAILERNRCKVWLAPHKPERDKYGRLLGELFLDSLGTQPLASALIAEWLRRQSESASKPAAEDSA